MRTQTLATSLTALAVASTLHAQTHVYVDDDAPDGGDGLTWGSALNDLQEAIDLAAALGASRGEIRVAGGRYVPSSAPGQTPRPFQLPIFNDTDGLFEIKGGYAGVTSPGSPFLRNPDLYPTLLDADALVNDTDSFASRFDNAPVLLEIGDLSAADNLLSAIVLDGLQFRGASSGAVRAPVSAISLQLNFRDCDFFENIGRAGSAIQLKDIDLKLTSCDFRDNRGEVILAGQNDGGAVDIEGGTIEIQLTRFAGNSHQLSTSGVGAALTLRRCDGTITESSFEYNESDAQGGAIYLDDADVRVEMSHFVGNTSRDSSGGAVYVESISGITRFTDCEFQKNDADLYGGALYSNDRVSIERCTLHANSAGLGGAIAGYCVLSNSTLTSNLSNTNGGALSLTQGSYISGCLFESNEASSGGAIGFLNSSRTDRIRIRYSTFRNNTADRGGAIWDVNPALNNGEIELDHCEFIANEASLAAGAVHGTNLISACIFERNQTGGFGGAVANASAIDTTGFIANTAGGSGGAVAFTSELRQCDFLENAATAGGAVYDTNVINTCYFFRNTATNYGSACVMRSDTYDLISDSVFVDAAGPDTPDSTMISKSGAGMFDLIRCTIVGTNENSPLQLRLFSADTWIESTILWTTFETSLPTISLNDLPQAVFVHCNLLQENIDIGSDTDVIFLGGNISADPQFEDVAAGNVRLTQGSPCIDAGILFLGDNLGPNDDVYGEPRTPLDDPGTFNTGQGDGGFIDIGAVEFQGETCVPDVNRDGMVTPTDFNAWINAFNTGARAADQNLDGLITPTDFNAWIANYLFGCP